MDYNYLYNTLEDIIKHFIFWHKTISIEDESKIYLITVPNSFIARYIDWKTKLEQQLSPGTVLGPMFKSYNQNALLFHAYNSSFPEVKDCDMIKDYPHQLDFN